MLTKKTAAAMCSLVLAGSMVVPAFAAEAIPAPRPGYAAETVLAGYATAPGENLPVAAPEALLTRAELVGALYEREGKPVVNFAMNYSDVAQGDAYAEAIRWAASEGIAGGYGDGTFGPEDAVTREQMAVILYQYAKYHDQGFTGAWAFPLGYEDAGEVSEFAYEAVCWVTMKDIMGPVEENRFAPGAAVTHEQAALMLQQYNQGTEQAEIANPFVSCQTLNDAAKLAGFSVKLPDGMEPQTIRAVEGSMIEVLCEQDGQSLTLRKAVGTQDISGDYTPYSETDVRECGGKTVTLKGEPGAVMTATWSSGGYAYAVRAEAGLDQEAMLAVAQNMQ